MYTPTCIHTSTCIYTSTTRPACNASSQPQSPPQPHSDAILHLSQQQSKEHRHPKEASALKRRRQQKSRAREDLAAAAGCIDACHHLCSSQQLFCVRGALRVGCSHACMHACIHAYCIDMRACMHACMRSLHARMRAHLHARVSSIFLVSISPLLQWSVSRVFLYFREAPSFPFLGFICMHAHACLHVYGVWPQGLHAGELTGLLLHYFSICMR